jgi:hypothetical protein
VAAWGLAALTAAPLAARAAPEPTNVAHVLELASDFDLQARAQALTNLLRLRVGDGGDFLLASQNPSLVVVATAVRCDVRGLGPGALRQDADRGIDEGCQRSIAARLGAERFFWGHLYSGPEGRLWVKAHLWQRGQAARTKALPYDEATRERLIGRLYEHLVHPERAADVRLGGPVGLAGELYVDDKAYGPFAEGAEVTVTVGGHAFEVRREGKVVARAKAAATVARANAVRLEAVASPPANVGPTSPPVGPPPVEGTSGAWKRPAGFVGLGLGAALLGAGLASSLRVRALDDDFSSDAALVRYRGGIAVDSDACDAAGVGLPSAGAGASTPGRVDRLCSALSTFRVAQYVFYGAGALAVGAGAYLLATAPSPRRAPASVGPVARTWSLRPWAAPGAGGAWFGSSF